MPWSLAQLDKHERPQETQLSHRNGSFLRLPSRLLTLSWLGLFNIGDQVQKEAQVSRAKTSKNARLTQKFLTTSEGS